MSRSKATYRGNARFIELGSMGAPFRSLINVDHISNVRFEQKIGERDATFDDDGQMTAPPQQVHEGWMIVIVIGHGAGGQNIFLPEEAQAVELYNRILDMVGGAGVPLVRMPKLQPLPVTSMIEGLDGAPIANDELPGEVPELTDEELDQLENPEIDVDAIAEAVEHGLGMPADEPIDEVAEPDDDPATG